MQAHAEIAGRDPSELLRSYPRRRPPLTPAHEKVYAEQYRLNRDGAKTIENLAQRLERWMHRRVASIRAAPVLELGAGTLNHVRYEAPGIDYDVVEPFRELYTGRAEAAAVRSFYGSVSDIPLERRYARVISIAVLEHMDNLPLDVAFAALRLADGGVFQAGIPSEAGVLWGLGWRASTALSYYMRTGLDYGTVMRHEHLNTAPEIIAIVRHLFADVRLRRFPFPWHHASFYTYVEAREPRRERCRALVDAARVGTTPS